MYLSYYRLREAPFNITPDPSFLYWSPSHKEAVASITYGVDKRKGFIALVGEVGSGKTTILLAYLDNVDPERVKTVYLINPELDFDGLTRAIYRELELPGPPEDLTEAVDNLHQYLIKCYERDVRVVLVIDEAQRMPVETLERLRVLSNLETSTAKLLQIVLCGQPEFERLLACHALRQLRERVAVRAEIRLLRKTESISYVEHRLACVGAEVAKVFSRRALGLIVQRALGNPRLLNIICDNALVAGYASHERPISPRTIKETVASLDMMPKSAFTRRAVSGVVFLFVLAAVCGTYLWLTPGRPQVELPSATTRQEHARLTDIAETTTESADFYPVPPGSFEEEKDALPEEAAFRSQRTPSAAGQAPKMEAEERALDEIRRLLEIVGSRAPKMTAEERAPEQAAAVVQEDVSATRAAADKESAALNVSSTLLPPPQSLEQQAGEESATDGIGENETPLTAHGADGVTVVTVQEGDTLERLIRRVNGDGYAHLVRHVMALNPHIRNENLIFPGESILIPKLTGKPNDRAEHAEVALVAAPDA